MKKYLIAAAILFPGLMAHAMCNGRPLEILAAATSAHKEALRALPSAVKSIHLSATSFGAASRDQNLCAMVQYSDGRSVNGGGLDLSWRPKGPKPELFFKGEILPIYREMGLFRFVLASALTSFPQAERLSTVLTGSSANVWLAQVITELQGEPLRDKALSFDDNPVARANAQGALVAELESASETKAIRDLRHGILQAFAKHSPVGRTFSKLGFRKVVWMQIRILPRGIDIQVASDLNPEILYEGAQITVVRADLNGEPSFEITGEGTIQPYINPNQN